MSENETPEPAQVNETSPGSVFRDVPIGGLFSRRLGEQSDLTSTVYVKIGDAAALSGASGDETLWDPYFPVSVLEQSPQTSPFCEIPVGVCFTPYSPETKKCSGIVFTKTSADIAQSQGWGARAFLPYSKHLTLPPSTAARRGTMSENELTETEKMEVVPVEQVRVLVAGAIRDGIAEGVAQALAAVGEQIRARETEIGRLSDDDWGILDAAAHQLDPGLADRQKAARQQSDPLV